MTNNINPKGILGLIDTIAKLRDPESGCPWNIEQTHSSLKRHLLEETYETLDAIDQGDAAELKEELGDLLLQVVLHASIAEENREYNFEDIAESSNQKMIRRHPHVFSKYDLDDSNMMGSLDKMWEDVKNAEKAGEAASPFASIPAELPSLARALKVLKKARKTDLDYSTLLPEVKLPELNLKDDYIDLLIALTEKAREERIDLEDGLRIRIAEIQKNLEEDK